ncbi:MAG TPA: HAD family hydrolase [Actinomycetota bacterium]
MPKRAVELVVTDLDGTLCDASECIHPRVIAAVHQLEAAGIPVLIATGRRPRATAWVLEPGGIPGPAVMLDGAIGRDLRDGSVFHEAVFPPEGASRVLAAFVAAHLSPSLFVERPGVEMINGPRPDTHPGHLARNRAWAVRDDLERVVRTEPVRTIAVVGGDGARLAEVAATIDPTAGSAAVTPDLLYGGHTLQVRPPGTSKWSGVLSFCAAHGLDPTRVLAVGDGNNDLELLDAAAVPVAVTGGSPTALARARHVIDPPSAGGWAAVLDLV